MQNDAGNSHGCFSSLKGHWQRGALRNALTGRMLLYIQVMLE